MYSLSIVLWAIDVRMLWQQMYLILPNMLSTDGGASGNSSIAILDGVVIRESATANVAAYINVSPPHVIKQAHVSLTRPGGCRSG